ncbi:unnamed protein product [Peronospora farinosa]|uniref:Uncharacterized protein n=1 Tax=Peronospora farinosa TaxID=134698 RepID=A0AAV0UQ17_9STRA|nr:unnamed protein product [Peronospora farinosa]CAI5738033.1 unnamed protein product [Peronospora farinosa]
MPSKKKPRSSYRSSLADNARPGGPTTMDVLLRWITKPGNVKRWRMETHSPLVREVVEIMQEEGLAHRQAPFVRYKLDAIEKQYITAKQWLLETGMHDAYMRGKASKEVKVHVENVCPQFKRLDPAFRGVSFSKRNAELIELDGDSFEDVEVREVQGKKGEEDEESEEESEEEERGEENEEEGENSDHSVDTATKNGNSVIQALNKKTATSTEPQKRTTFRDRLFSSTARVAEKGALSSAELQKKSNAGKKQLSSSTANAIGKEKTSTLAEPQKKTNGRVVSSIVNDSGKEKAITPDESEKNKSRSKESTVSAAVEVAKPHTGLEDVTSTPSPAKKRRGRLPKAVAAVRPTRNEATKTAVSANAKNEAPLQSTVITRKRKVSEEEPSTVKETSTKKSDEANEELMTIEREALLERVKEAQKQRHEVYKLERSKLECELESKRVQLLFEKASARKKLDLLGVSEEEIDRILPL